MFKRSHSRRRMTIATMFVGLVAALSMGGAMPAFGMGTDGGSTTNPWIQSDQADYSPGSTVTLTGGNWHSGESVHIVVDDTTNHTWNHIADVRADDLGSIQDIFD